MKNWKTWVKGLINAAIGGGASAITVMIVDPQAFNIHDLKKVGIVALVAMIVAVAMYLQRSPLPE